jgi:hypothetical protein
MMSRNSASTILAFVFLLIPSISVFAQSQTTGRIAGTVLDRNGAVVVNADVTVHSNATGEERTVLTDNDGNYSAPLLPSGKYRVTVKARGFGAAVIDSVQVSITETTIKNVELEPGEIIADFGIVPIPLVQTDGPTQGRVIDSRAVSRLPSATLNYTQFLALSPGTSVSLPDNTALGRNSQNISVNGARVTQNNFQLNGVDANKTDTNSAAYVAVPAPETIQEFKVQTSLYDATFGRGGGGNVQAVTRSGSNDFHGGAYEYFRNEALNANNPFLKAAGVERPVLRRNVFGGLTGGPIKRDRIFFFGSYQGTRERNGASQNSLSSDILISPPGLTSDRSAQTLLATFKPTLRNGLPATSIDPAALGLLNAKLPNGQFVIPTPQADGHYSGTSISAYREDQFNSNLDVRLNQKDWLAAKFFFSNAPHFFALPDGGANVPGFGADLKQDNRVLSLQEIHTIRPTLINEARIGYNFISQETVGRNPVRDSDLGIQRANSNVYPGLGRIVIGQARTNGLTIGNAGTGVDIQVDESSTTLVDIVSLVHGPHSLRTGVEIIDYRADLTTNNFRRGQINFQNFNNFLIGSVSSSTYGEGINTRKLRATDYNMFLQDDWKFSRRLTLNLGLRYELDLPPYETRGVMATFDPALYVPRIEVDNNGNPVGPPIGGFVQAGNVIPQYDVANVPNVSKRVLTSIDPNNFAPRVGFAYSLLDSGRVVIRGGYGIFYSRPSMTYIGETINSPPTYAVRRSPIGVITLSDPFFPLPSQNEFPKFVEGVALAGNSFDRGMRTPYFQQYNSSVQYAPGKDLLLEVAYVGTRGLKLIRNVAINQALLASPQHPVINEVLSALNLPGAMITTNTPANAQLRAPYQGVDIAGFAQLQTTAQSSYNSLQMSLTKRLSKGLQFLAAYTFSRSIDNASGGGGSTGDAKEAAPISGNQLDNRANRGLSNFDRTHRLVLSYLWDVPPPALAEKSITGRRLLSNWQVAGIVTAMSGLPIDIVDSAAASLFGLSGGSTPSTALARPSWAPGATRTTAMSNIPMGYFFNPFAFVRPVVLTGQVIPSSNGSAIAGATGTDFGTVGRNVLRGPSQNNVDFSISKRFPIHESKSVEFRAEFFNLFNHVNFANPVSNFNAVPQTSISESGQILQSCPLTNGPCAGDFGRITATSNNPRLIQIAAKISF